MANQPPLSQNNPIVDEKGRPRPFFVLLINQLLKGSIAQAVADAAAALALAIGLGVRVTDIENSDLIAGVGIDGGGLIGDAPLTFDLADTAVTPGVYGDANDTPVITVDQQGRITDIITVPTSGSGGGGGIYVPLVNGDLPGPGFIASSYGECIMVEIV